MDSRMDAMTERDVVAKFVELAVYRERWARIRQQVNAIRRRHDRIWNDEIRVKEELQDGNASTADCSVSGRVGRVCGGTFWICLR